MNPQNETLSIDWVLYQYSFLLWNSREQRTFDENNQENYFRNYKDV